MSSIKTTQIDGDVSVGRNVSLGGKAEISGSARIGHDLKVEGWLEAPNIKDVNKGFYRSVEALESAYPSPRDGWLAGVGVSTPFAAYIGTGGVWEATGGTIDVTLDDHQYDEDISQLQDDIAEVKSDVVTGVTGVRIDAVKNGSVRKTGATFSSIGLGGSVNVTGLSIGSDGVITSQSGSNRSKYLVTYVKQPMNKGDVLHVHKEHTGALRMAYGFTTTDPSTLESLVGLQLDLALNVTAETHEYDFMCPYDNAYLLYYYFNDGAWQPTTWTFWRSGGYEIQRLKDSLTVLDAARAASIAGGLHNLDLTRARLYKNQHWRISNSGDVWFWNNDSEYDYELLLLPVKPCTRMALQAKQTETMKFATAHFLKSYPDFNTMEQGDTPDYCESVQMVRSSNLNMIHFDTPADCVCVYVQVFNTAYGTNVFPFAYIWVRDEDMMLTKRFAASVGFLSASTGLYPATAAYYIGYSHTPKYIKNRGAVIIRTVGVTGKVYCYDRNQAYMGSDARIDIDTTGGAQYVDIPSTVSFIRIALSTQIDCIDIDGFWEGDDDVFQALPATGYQPMTFAVRAVRCNAADTTSTLHEQYQLTTDSGMLHLPPSYKADGAATPLIIFIHGASDNYTMSSTAFPASCPLAPEWAAAGFAQMDVDLIPDLYNDRDNNAHGGSSDDAECIFGAYRWAVEHFNLRRDGVYLIGRSRGGQAVLQVLGKYNPAVMPVVAAVSNAGAHAPINYGLTNSSAAKFFDLICQSYSLPEEGRPTPSGNSTLIAQDSVYSYLLQHISQWWKKAQVALSLLTDNGNAEQTAEDMLEFMHSHPRVSGIDDADYLGFLEKMRFRSPVPLRFDWCVADTTQPWKANEGRGNYSAIVKDGFVKNPSGNAVYREWPDCADGADISGVTDKPHWHELFNIYSGDYTLPGGAVVANPSMARVEWLLWCMSHDNRF